MDERVGHGQSDKRPHTLFPLSRLVSLVAGTNDVPPCRPIAAHCGSPFTAAGREHQEQLFPSMELMKRATGQEGARIREEERQSVHSGTDCTSPQMPATCRRIAAGHLSRLPCVCVCVSLTHETHETRRLVTG